MEITKSEVATLIHEEARDTFWHHFWNMFLRNNTPKGEIGHREIKVWRSNPFLRGSYPIYIFKFNEENHLIDIQDKKNPVTKWMNIVLFLGIGFIFVPHSLEIVDWTNTILLFLAGVVIIGSLWLIMRKSYEHEKKLQLKKIYDHLEIEVEEEPEEKEWSLKMILTRLFLYPFCIALILLAVFELFPAGQYLLALFSIIFSCMFLIPDILILIRKARKNNTKRTGH